MRARSRKEISFIFTSGMAHDFYGQLHDSCCVALRERFGNKFRIHFNTVVRSDDQSIETDAIELLESQDFERLAASVIVPHLSSIFSARVADTVLKQKVPVIALAPI